MKTFERCIEKMEEDKETEIITTVISSAERYNNMTPRTR